MKWSHWLILCVATAGFGLSLPGCARSTAVSSTSAAERDEAHSRRARHPALRPPAPRRVSQGTMSPGTMSPGIAAQGIAAHRARPRRTINSNNRNSNNRNCSCRNCLEPVEREQTDKLAEEKMNHQQKILVACDFADSDESVRRTAAVMAGKLGAELHLLHVVSKKDRNGRSQEQMRHTKERLERLLPPEQVLNLSCHWEVREGATAKQITRYANENEVDLIIVGIRDRRGIARLVKHDVADDVVKSTSCPVMVIPHCHATEPPSQEDACQLLREQFGEILEGDREMARVQMQELLENRFDISSNDADSILEQLEITGALVYGELDATDADRVDAKPLAWQIQADFASHPAQRPAPVSFEPTAAATPALDLLKRARLLRATDIHIDPTVDNNYSVRLRIDGQLEHYCDLDTDLAAHLLQQIKVLANMNITEPFRAHEGCLQLPHANWDCHVRITSAPVAGGESICLRLQTQERIFRPLSELGLASPTVGAINQMLRRGEGIVLVTGPTGAGKTTTVYSMLRELEANKPLCNIVTIEDPVEFRIPFLRQMNVDESHGATLNSGLRTALRMDPDIIFVGEIRDSQTAEMAMRSELG